MRLADILIDQVEKMFLPGLRQAIEVKEVATPLTNLRFTSNPRGAIYGWDQTVDNSGQRRFPQKTPDQEPLSFGGLDIPRPRLRRLHSQRPGLLRPGHGGLEKRRR